MQNSAFKVGVFVTVAAAALGGVILFFGEIPLFKEEQAVYYAYFKNVGGLSVGSDVRVAGVKVGRVKEITFEGNKVKVVLTVAEGVPIYKNAVAKIESLGLLGDKYVEINPGSPQAGRLPPGSAITYTVQPADMGKMMDELAKTAESIRKLSDNLNALVEENRRQLRGLITNLNLLAANLNLLLENNSKNITETVERIKLLTKSLNEKLPPLIDNLNRLSTTLEQSAKTLSPKFGRAADSIARLSEDLDAVARTIKNQREEIAKTLKNISQITSAVKTGRGTLGKLIKDESLYYQLKKSAKLLGEASGVITKTKIHIEAFAQYEGTGDSKAGVDLMIKPGGDKYYLLGIVGDSAGKVTKKTYYYNGKPVEVVEKEYKPEFTLQYAKIFRDYWFHPGSAFVFRFGIKESTGGVGLDYIYNERLMFTADVWDFGRQDRPNEDLKPNTEVGLKYMVYGPFFVKAGGYDLLNPQYRTVFVGGGLSFTDNDLKYLLGGMSFSSFK
jgi:phospholipid/cholesterol/gamma-HCH transport system substrate-binding protein